MNTSLLHYADIKRHSQELLDKFESLWRRL